MKRLFLTSVLACSLGTLFAQNYVPNYSFETDSACPNNYNQVEYCSDWKKSLNNNVSQYHTEYLNACGTPSFSVPSNTWGMQAAATGSAYMCTVSMAPQVQPDYRENIYTHLISPLQVGVTYNVSLKISFTDNSQHASNNFGVKFSTTPNFPIDNISQVYTSTVVSDKQNWVIISGSFVADSNYSYIAVGNFFTDANTISVTTCQSCPFNQHAYYVDDICVLSAASTDFAVPDCAVPVTPAWVPVSTSVDTRMTIVPNPASGDVVLHFSAGENKEAFVVMYDLYGREVYRSATQKGMEQQWTIDTRNFATGVYTVRAEGEGNSWAVKKLVISR